MNSEAIEVAAAQWVIRRSGEAWTEADQEGLDSWLSESTLHRVAYLRLEAVWQQTARLNALGAGIPPSVVPSPGSWSSVQFRSPSIEQPRSGQRMSFTKRWIALAASLLLALMAGLYWIFVHIERPEQFITLVGGLQTVRLADSSVVTLNTNTHLRAYLRGRQRRIELDTGEAHFAVAKDPSRPFVIRVADKMVTAVGTELSVRRTVSDVQVLVTDGLVELRQAGTSDSRTILKAGTLARTVGSEVLVRQVSNADAEQLLSWRSGFLTFRDTSLANAVAEFNRYQSRKLVIADPSLATIRIGGKFRTSNVQAFLSLLQEGFPVTIDESGSQLVIKRRT